MTYSIVARNATTGEYGIAVASRFFACGSLVPHVTATAAMASQAFVNPLWGTEGLPRLDAGEAPQEILRDFIPRYIEAAYPREFLPTEHMEPFGTVASLPKPRRKHRRENSGAGEDLLKVFNS